MRENLPLPIWTPNRPRSANCPGSHFHRDIHSCALQLKLSQWLEPHEQASDTRTFSGKRQPLFPAESSAPLAAWRRNCYLLSQAILRCAQQGFTIVLRPDGLMGGSLVSIFSHQAVTVPDEPSMVNLTTFLKANATEPFPLKTSLQIIDRWHVDRTCHHVPQISQAPQDTVMSRGPMEKAHHRYFVLFHAIQN